MATYCYLQQCLEYLADTFMRVAGVAAITHFLQLVIQLDLRPAVRLTSWLNREEVTASENNFRIQAEQILFQAKNQAKQALQVFS